jgi:hypothetical protein
LGLADTPYTQAPWLQSLLAAASNVDTHAIATAAAQAPEFAQQKGELIATHITAAREAAIAGLV